VRTAASISSGNTHTETQTCRCSLARRTAASAPLIPEPGKGGTGYIRCALADTSAALPA